MEKQEPISLDQALKMTRQFVSKRNNDPDEVDEFMGVVEMILRIILDEPEIDY